MIAHVKPFAWIDAASLICHCGQSPQLPWDKQSSKGNNRLASTASYLRAGSPDFADRFFDLLANKRFPCSKYFLENARRVWLPTRTRFLSWDFWSFRASAHWSRFCCHRAIWKARLPLPPQKQRVLFLARLYWFTATEFAGLVKEGDRLKIYGGGISSSPAETNYALEGDMGRSWAFRFTNGAKNPLSHRHHATEILCD